MRSTHVLTALVTTCVLAVAAAHPAQAAIVIDDFESNGFDYTVAGDTIDVNHYISPPGHAIWSPRHVRFSCTPGWLGGVYLDAGSQIDDEVNLVGAFSWIEFDYNWGFPWDITEGGAVETLDVDCPEIDPGGDVIVTLYDADGEIYGRNLFTPQVGINSYNLPQLFPGIDLTRLTRIKIRFNIRLDIVAIADIRTRGTARRAVNYEGNFVAVQTPPIPTPPLTWRIYDEFEQPLYRAGLRIENFDVDGDVAATSARWEEAEGLGGEIAGVQFFWDEDAALSDATVELSLDMRRAVPGGLMPELASAPELVSNTDGILITFSLWLRALNGSIAGSSDVRLLFDIGAGQPVKFTDVVVTPESGPGKSPDGESDLASVILIGFHLEPFGTVDGAMTLFEATWTCDWAAATATDVAGPGAASPSRPDAVTLAAWPSVTRAGTEIRASAPLDAPSAIAIYDASGRLVRTLVMPRGASAVTWDGRGAEGATTPSGAYFARIDAASRHASTRIVRIR